MPSSPSPSSCKAKFSWVSGWYGFGHNPLGRFSGSSFTLFLSRAFAQYWQYRHVDANVAKSWVSCNQFRRKRGRGPSRRGGNRYNVLTVPQKHRNTRLLYFYLLYKLGSATLCFRFGHVHIVREGSKNLFTEFVRKGGTPPPPIYGIPPP